MIWFDGGEVYGVDAADLSDEIAWSMGVKLSGAQGVGTRLRTNFDRVFAELKKQQ